MSKRKMTKTGRPVPTSEAELEAAEAELEAAIGPLRERLYAIRQAREVAEYAGLVGRFFKYRNRYSEDESWWLYTAVIVVGEYRPKCLSFQLKSDGVWEIETRDNHTLNSGWTEISRDEFDREWGKMVVAIRDLWPSR